MKSVFGDVHIFASSPSAVLTHAKEKVEKWEQQPKGGDPIPGEFAENLLMRASA